MTKWTSRILLACLSATVLVAEVENSLAKVPEVKLASAETAERKPATGDHVSPNPEKFFHMEEGSCLPQGAEAGLIAGLVEKGWELKSVVSFAPFDGTHCNFYFTKKTH